MNDAWDRLFRVHEVAAALEPPYSEWAQKNYARERWKDHVQQGLKSIKQELFNNADNTWDLDHPVWRAALETLNLRRDNEQLMAFIRRPYE
jgi:hypothetical protein